MAITNEATIRVKIDGKDAEVNIKDMGRTIETAMKRGKVEADKLKTSFTKIGDAAQRFYFSFQSLKIFVRGAMDFIRASNEQAMAVAGMEQALRSMGRYTGEFSGQIQKLARQIQSEGVIGDEAIIEGTKFLATYKDISNEVLPDTMKVMADLAAYMKGDVRSAANMLGKASMGMTGELRRVGISISDATMKSKDFNDILREIKEQVAGQNRAMAEADGGIRAFQMSIGDLKEFGGDLMKLFIMPLIRRLKDVSDWLQTLDKSTVAMIGSIGLIGFAFLKLIPIIKLFGIVSKASLGWIGLIMTALAALYTAWTTNFLGIRDALTGFWGFLKGWAKQIGTTLSALGKIIVGVLTFSGTKIKEGWNELKNSFVSTWKAAFEKVKKDGEKTIPPAKGKIQPAFEAAGEVAGEAFYTGFDKGIDKAEKDERKGWRKFEKEMRKLDKAIKGIDKGFKDENGVSREETPFEAWKRSLNDMQDIAKQSFDVIGNSMQMLSDRLTQALFNTKTKFKDLWVAMAMDFTRIFVNYVIAGLAKFLAFKVIGNILPNLVVPGSGSTINSVKLMNTPFGGNFSNNIENQLVALNRNVQRISPVVNNNISSRQLYNAVKFEREKDLIRRGRDINNNLF